MLLTPLPIVTLESFVQFLNTVFPRDVTELGRETLVRLVQPSNAEYSIWVTELGIDTLVRPVQSLNAVPAILVTVFGIVTEVTPVQVERDLKVTTVWLLSVLGMDRAPVGLVLEVVVTSSIIALPLLVRA